MGGVRTSCEAVSKTESVRTLVYITSDKCYRNVDWEVGLPRDRHLGRPRSLQRLQGLRRAGVRCLLDLVPVEGQARATASTRAGNVIGGGDWAKDRLIPDCVRAPAQEGDDRDPIILNRPGPGDM